MRHLLIVLITLYQRFISPYKGFRCAYGCYHQGPSCSGQVKRILAEHGVRAGWPLIRAQFQACQEAFDALSAQESPENEPGDRRRRRHPPPRRRCCSRSTRRRRNDYSDCVPDLPDIGCDVCDIGGGCGRLGLGVGKQTDPRARVEHM